VTFRRDRPVGARFRTGVVIAALVGTTVLAGCGDSGGTKTAATTTTSAPVATTTTTLPPAVVTANPPTSKAGTDIALAMTGGKPGETVTFTITSPSGKAFTGPPHTVDTSGTATATYGTAGNAAGAYKVLGTGSMGTTATTSFTLTPGPPVNTGTVKTATTTTKPKATPTTTAAR
jgi:hypothetical protein